MLESLIAIGILTLFVLIGIAASAAGETMLWAGIAIAAFGFAYGIPAAIVYHWRLYRSLLRVNRLPKRWWLAPTKLHDQIPGPDRRVVLRWAMLGGSGFVVIVLGIILTSAGLWRTFAG